MAEHNRRKGDENKRNPVKEQKPRVEDPPTERLPATKGVVDKWFRENNDDK